MIAEREDNLHFDILLLHLNYDPETWNDNLCATASETWNDNLYNSQLLIKWDTSWFDALDRTFCGDEIRNCPQQGCMSWYAYLLSSLFYISWLQQPPLTSLHWLRVNALSAAFNTLFTEGYIILIYQRLTSDYGGQLYGFRFCKILAMVQWNEVQMFICRSSVSLFCVLIRLLHYS